MLLTFKDGWAERTTDLVTCYFLTICPRREGLIKIDINDNEASSSNEVGLKSNFIPLQ